MKKAVMYGAGNIGRGFITQLFAKSGFETALIDVNKSVIEKLNTDKCYPVKVVSEEGMREDIVTNVYGVDGTDIDAAADTIASADVMATAVGVNILPRIAGTIAEGIRRRFAKCDAPLNIIISENLIDADKYLASLIKEKLSSDEQKLFDERIGLVEASIGRMVPIMSEEMQEGNILKVWVEPFCELPVDKNGFKGEIPSIVNMTPFTPFEYFIQKKLFLHNMGHAATAYYGILAGKHEISEAIAMPEIYEKVRAAMLESSAALSAEHGVPYEEVLTATEDLLHRFANPHLHDTLTRVGRDVLRKLAKGDRLIGAALLCEKHGLPYENILRIAAAATLFPADADEFSAKLHTMIDTQGLEDALASVTGLDANSEIIKKIAAMRAQNCLDA